MGEIVVYRNGATHLQLVERNARTIKSAVLSQELLADDSVNVKVESKTALDLKINDYIFIDGLTYRLNQLPSVTKNAENNFEYDIIFQGLMFDLKRCKFFNADANDFKTELEFPLIGDLEFFLTVVRNNMRRFSIDWEVGNFPANTETKSLSFSSDNCLSALQKICQEYKVEFWIKQENGKFKIHTGAFGNTIPTTLEYGKGNGLYSLSRKNVNENDVVSRLYVNGGSTNIPNEYRGFSKNLLMPDSAYLEDTALIGEIGLNEGSITFEDIYPKRTGIISALGTSVFKFVDSSMDFNLNEKEADGVTTKYLIPGTTAKIHFNTGNLAGYQFEIKKGGYDHATKTFEIIPFTNEQGQKFPDENSQAFQFSVGDEYKILDIYMPESYITNSENELLAKATEQFNLLKQPKVSYDLKTVPEFLKSLSTPIQIGDMVNVKDTALGVDKVLRVQKISKNLITDEVESIEIADAYEINFASKLIIDVKEIKNVVNITKLGEINYSKLGLKTTEELKNLVFDTDGYFDAGNIKPFSIETNMLSVGSRSQQLSLSSVFRINQDGNANKVDVTAGILFSQTLDKTWNVSALVSTLPDNDYRYVYAKASKTTSAASIYLSKNQISFDSDVNDFYFLVGILHSVVDGVRVLSITVGTTTISGGLVRTGIISSLDGLTYFNLNTGEIIGKIKFLLPDGSIKDIIELEQKTNFLTGTSIEGNAVATGILLLGNSEGTNAGITGLGTEDEIFLWGGSTFANRNNAKVWLKRNGHFRFLAPNGLSFDSQTGTITNRYTDTAGNPLSLFIGTNAQGNPEITFYDRSGNITFRMNPNGIDFPNEVPESWTAISLKSAGNTIARPLDSTTRTQMINTIKAWVCYDGTKEIYAIKSHDLVAYDYFAGNSAYSEGYRQYEGLKTSNTSRTSNINDGWYYYSSDSLMVDFETNEPLVEIFYISGGKKVYSENLRLPKYVDYLYVSCN